ncbi:MAG: hypothetical protein HY866_01940, partial [Chloroflexi bacterium]|nr:hypothetical protein [Chloroflexota bacterium]
MVIGYLYVLTVSSAMVLNLWASATLYSSYERPEARTAALLLLIVAVLGLLYLLVVFTVDRDLAFIFVR